MRLQGCSQLNLQGTGAHPSNTAASAAHVPFAPAPPSARSPRPQKRRRSSGRTSSWHQPPWPSQQQPAQGRARDVCNTRGARRAWACKRRRRQQQRQRQRSRSNTADATPAQAQAQAKQEETHAPPRFGPDAPAAPSRAPWPPALPASVDREDRPLVNIWDTCGGDGVCGGRRRVERVSGGVAWQHAARSIASRRAGGNAQPPPHC